MSNDTRPDHSAYLTRLSKALAHRGDRAALRRYWSETTRHQSYPVLGKIGALEDKRKTILAALYAEHPEQRLGISIGKGALRLGKREDGNHPYDKHFRRLLASDDLEDLAQQLHRLVKRLSREGIGIDYELLQKNLNFWANYREDVKLRWAADFWQADIPNDNPQALDA
ncbi:type I-E CRISPR-associated protein Cse2/CasB [Roseibacillus persicicus]|uniref:type I-E CRISPR-associated protein Cse2/CasB n=1 Tax=Roseibacillus persicicus TaxID=454148 RepID=UPI00280F36FC|nr:type I-E CRISPR-associated protein Cse2/CasB [Roseibacillus persicicus]MDQ8189674.1 type I-E CRISPR-associated protein Cse2/CasB [Roseibacillus persicicus]